MIVDFGVNDEKRGYHEENWKASNEKGKISG